MLRAFRELSAPVEARAYTRPGKSRDRMLRTLRELQTAGGERFAYELLDLTREPVEQQARAEGIPNEGITLSFRGKTHAVLWDDPTPSRVAQRILQLNAESSGKPIDVGLLTKGGVGFEGDLIPLTDRNAKHPTVMSVLTEAFPYYRFQPPELDGGRRAVDPRLDGLIVTQPNEVFTRGELEKLDEFLMQGDKTLVVYASAANPRAHDSSLVVPLDLHGLDTWLRGYGIEMHADLVLDLAAPVEFVVVSQDGNQSQILYPPVTMIRPSFGTLDAQFEPFADLRELVFPFPSSLALSSGKQPADVHAKVVARSSQHARTETKSPLDLRLRQFRDWKTSTEERTVPLAIALEGRLKSAFSERRAARPSRLLVISSGMFLTNPFAHAGNSVPPDEQLSVLASAYAKQHLTGMILSVKQVIDWMTLGELRTCNEVD
jgi:hypothetical protein